MQAKVLNDYAEALGTSTLRRIVCVTSSEHLYFNGKPKTDLKTILTTVGTEIPNEFPIALSKFINEKKHIHFEFKSPPSIMSTGQRMLQGSRSLPQPFSSFPELKPETTIPNTIFNKLIETVQKLGGGFAESSCKWKNPNNRGNANKPLGIYFFDELSKVIRSIAGNLQKFKHFPPELKWAQDTWKKMDKIPNPIN